MEKLLLAFRRSVPLIHLLTLGNLGKWFYKVSWRWRGSWRGDCGIYIYVYFLYIRSHVRMDSIYGFGNFSFTFRTYFKRWGIDGNCNTLDVNELITWNLCFRISVCTEIEIKTTLEITQCYICLNKMDVLSSIIKKKNWELRKVFTCILMPHCTI